LDQLQLSSIGEKWCVNNVDLSDDGNTIADAIRNRVAIAVSDGSFKDTYGTVAWVLEGDNSAGCIIGRVISPGTGSDQSAYRSKLSGILAIMIMVKHICSYHHISEGSVELACDGLSALNKAFSQVSILQLEDPNYDLIAAIKHQWHYSPLLWKIQHVKGHQDDHTAIQQLDRWGQLNVEMDLLAKAYIPFAKNQPRHYTILGEPWSIWVGGKKIVKDIAETLYEIAHVESVKQYWISKDRVTTDSFSEIHWDAMKKAMLQSPRSRCTFASKHTVGMCGAGKFMQRWKEWESPNCPRCGQFEDAAHVWVCSGSNAGDIWEKSLRDLDEWMSSVNTDPDIQSAILHFLQSWRSDTTPTISLDSDIAQQQNTLGWQQFFEGWIPVCWEEAQQSYYSLIRSYRTGRRWIISLIKMLHGTYGNIAMASFTIRKTSQLQLKYAYYINGYKHNFTFYNIFHFQQ
jgi:hypothetical protein